MKAKACSASIIGIVLFLNPFLSLETMRLILGVDLAEIYCMPSSKSSKPELTALLMTS